MQPNTITDAEKTEKAETIELTAAEYAEFKAILAERAVAKRNATMKAHVRQIELRECFSDFNRLQAKIEKRDLVDLFAMSGANNDEIEEAEAACVAEHQANLKRYKTLLVELCMREQAIVEPANEIESAPDIARERMATLNALVNLVTQSKYKTGPKWARLAKYQNTRSLLRTSAEQRYVADLIKRVRDIAYMIHEYVCDACESEPRFFELINTSPAHSDAILRAANYPSTIMHTDKGFAMHVNGMTYGIPHSIHDAKSFPYVEHADEISKIQREMHEAATRENKFKYDPELATTIKELSDEDNVITWNIECIREFEKRHGLTPHEF